MILLNRNDWMWKVFKIFNRHDGVRYHCCNYWILLNQYILYMKIWYSRFPLLQHQRHATKPPKYKLAWFYSYFKEMKIFFSCKDEKELMDYIERILPLLLLFSKLFRHTFSMYMENVLYHNKKILMSVFVWAELNCKFSINLYSVKIRLETTVRLPIVMKKNSDTTFCTRRKVCC